MERERKDTIELVIKIIAIIVIILLLIHNCSLIKDKNCQNDLNVIDINCKSDKCNALLKNIVVSPVNIDFKTNQYTYDITVDSNVEELVINAMPFDPSTKVKIPNNLTLEEGVNVFKIIATSKDGKQKIYTINVTKKPNNNKIIKNITVSPQDINFKEDVYTYNINVNKSVNKIDINVIPFDSSTKVNIPSDLSLKDGLNTFKIEVTTKDGNKVTYTINVKKESKNVKTPILKELTVSPKGIDFKEDVYTYDIEVDSNVSEVVINALPYDASTKIEIPSDLSLKEGLNTFVITVTTKDGTKKKYTINVNKKGTNKKVIKDITVGPKDIDFKEDVYTYDIEVDSNVNKITLDVLPFDENTSVKITPSDLSLKEGLNTFKVEATNKDGITKVYTINVTRKGTSSKVLKDIVVGPKDIDFKEDVYTYDIEVDNDVTSITIEAIPYDSSTKIVLPSNLSLEEGLNTFKVEATNKDGIKKVYTINVTREEGGLIVKDNDIHWSETSSVDIFENPLFDRGNIIAPESSNTYQFEVKNSTKNKVRYQIDFIEDNPYNINMKYKLRKNGTYLIDQEVSASELSVSGIEIDAGSSDIYYLEWHWVSNSNDTEIGNNSNSFYELKIDVKAESTNG